MGSGGSGPYAYKVGHFTHGDISPAPAFLIVISLGMMWDLTAVLICISLTANDLEYFHVPIGYF